MNVHRDAWRSSSSNSIWQRVSIQKTYIATLICRTRSSIPRPLEILASITWEANVIIHLSFHLSPMSVPRYTGTSLFVPWGMLGTPSYFSYCTASGRCCCCLRSTAERAEQISGAKRVHFILILRLHSADRLAHCIHSSTVQQTYRNYRGHKTILRTARIVQTLLQYLQEKKSNK
jgi:hypothetical protein